MCCTAVAGVYLVEILVIGRHEEAMRPFGMLGG